jgi:hypothetical protein
VSTAVHDFRRSQAFSHSRESLWAAIYARVFGENAHVETVPDGHPLQWRGVDRWVTDPATDWPTAVEEKLRSSDYGDVALEYLSNSKTGAPGWIAKEDQWTDVLLYALPTRVLILPWQPLREAWVDHKREWFAEAEGEEDGFRVVVARNSGYSSESLAVPIPDLLRAVEGSHLLTLPGADHVR